MNERIKPGDLVMVVRWPHACRPHNLGRIFRVHGIHGAGVRCLECGEDLANHGPSAETEERKGCPVSWCKRIPDFPELKNEKHDEEITA